MHRRRPGPSRRGNSVTGDAASQSAGALPLPAFKHLPGLNPRPEDGLLEAVIGQVPAVTRAEQAEKNVAWHYGIRLINEGFFWEAHEVLEPVWWNAAPNSRERFLVQGVIHLANAALKANIGRRNAAERLSDLADDCFDRAFAAESRRFMGLEKDDVLEAVARVRTGGDTVNVPLRCAL